MDSNEKNTVELFKLQRETARLLASTREKGCSKKTNGLALISIFLGWTTLLFVGLGVLISKVSAATP
jgi:hypothetical protein